MRKLIKPANIRKSFPLMLWAFLIAVGGLRSQQEPKLYQQEPKLYQQKDELDQQKGELYQQKGELYQQERELYQQDFYLNLNRKEDLRNDNDQPDRHWLDEKADEEKEESVQRDWYDDENQIVMLDDYFVVSPEGRKREGVLFFYLLPGFMGGLTLVLIWIYFKVWLNNKKELHQTRLQLWKLRSSFRGRETDPEFPEKLKEVLKLPPGATNRDIMQGMPVQDKELQQMIDKYYDNFRKSDS